MDTRLFNIGTRIIAGGMSVALVFATACFTSGVSATEAFAVTAAEKQAEADAVFDQIDSLQTSLNEAVNEYERASSAHDEAVELRDEAARQIKEETERIERLQDSLSQFAVGMYKKGGTGSFIDVVLEATSFEDFITSWDACNAISTSGTELLEEAKEARNKLEESKATYEEQSKRAEDEMNNAESTMAQIESAQAALREEAQKLSAEAAELQKQEELDSPCWY